MFLEWKFICNEFYWTANEFGYDFDMDDFLDKLNVVFSNTCACVFNHNLDWISFLHNAFYFRKLPTILSTVWMFLEFVQMVRLKRTWTRR